MMTGLKTRAMQVLASAVLITLSTAALAQSDAQKTFDKMKALTGEWQGEVTTSPAEMGHDMAGKAFHVSLRTTSSGNAILHEVTAGGMKDNPITMLYLDGDRLMLTHYCDAGNRPRMVAKSSPDGKTVKFDFLDLAGPTEHGHMDHAVFTFIDANHHTEDWTYMLPNNTPVLAHFDLTRAK
jgi:hypothetical protein